LPARARRKLEAITERLNRSKLTRWGQYVEFTTGRSTPRRLDEGPGRGVHHGPEPFDDIRCCSEHPQKTGDRKAPRSPSGICLYFVTPPESNAAPTTPNLLNINHIAEEPEWN
jgi:hypothetical protein